MKQDKKVRVAFYMRVSTAEQANGFSLEMQEEDLKAHVERNSYKGWHTDPRWHFSEQGSGGNMKRGELKRMLEMAKNREFDLVIVWKIDRISRSLTDLLDIFETLDKHDVGFASFKEDIDFTGPVGKLIFQIFGALAEFERENIRMRTEEGKRVSAKRGNFVGGSPPYGYKKVPNPKGEKGSKLFPVPNEAKVVKQIFEWYAYEKKTLAEIATELNNMGILKGDNARKDNKYTEWEGKYIRSILENETYSGSYVTNRYKKPRSAGNKKIERPREDWIVSEVPHIVNKALFMSTQELLKGGRKGKRGGGGRLYMLSGKLIDTTTGKGFVGYLSGKGTKNYRRKQFTDKQGTFQGSISIAAKSLETSIWNLVEKAALNPDAFMAIHQKEGENQQKIDSLSPKYKIYEQAYSKANERIGRVNDDYYNGDISKEEQNDLLEKYTEERDVNFIKMKEIEKEIRSLALYDVACRDLKKFSENMKNDIKNLTYAEKCHVVRIAVEKIEVYDEGEKRKVRPFFRFDQKAITSAMPEGRTDLGLEKGKKGKKSSQKVIDGGR